VRGLTGSRRFNLAWPNRRHEACRSDVISVPGLDKKGPPLRFSHRSTENRDMDLFMLARLKFFLFKPLRLCVLPVCAKIKQAKTSNLSDF